MPWEELRREAGCKVDVECYVSGSKATTTNRREMMAVIRRLLGISRRHLVATSHPARFNQDMYLHLNKPLCST